MGANSILKVNLVEIFAKNKVCLKFARSKVILAYGVIGNTTGFGPVILGSSPSRPTEFNSNSLKIGSFLFGGRKGEKRV